MTLKQTHRLQRVKDYLVLTAKTTMPNSAFNNFCWNLINTSSPEDFIRKIGREQDVLVHIYAARKASKDLETDLTDFENKIEQILAILGNTGEIIWTPSIMFIKKVSVSQQAEQVEMPNPISAVDDDLPPPPSSPPKLTRHNADPIPPGGSPYYKDDEGNVYYPSNELALSSPEVQNEQDRMSSERTSDLTREIYKRGVFARKP